MEFFDILSKNAGAYPERIIFEDEVSGTYSYEYVEITSGKIYGYLKKQGIGRENIVIIRMKRSARIYLAMLGVWKAAAAFVVIGEYSTEKYVNQVFNDAEGGFVFSDETFEEAVKEPYREGFMEAGEHDLSCIVYSTGSSGFFKGSMHEYGSVKMALKKLDFVHEKPLFETGVRESRNIMLNPLYSINSVIELLLTVFYGNYYYVAPYSAIINYSKLARLLNEKKIEVICVAENNYKKLKRYELPYLKRIDLSFDVSALEVEPGCNYTNTYALTEAFGWVTSGYVEKTDCDIVPCGVPCPLTRVKVCGRNGEALKQGEIGEICVYNEFFRGYCKRPDLTANILREGWIHTGDMGFVENNGEFVVLGRKIDMAETEEGYIIPVLISVQVKKHFPDITKNYVKLFKNGEQVKICVYYCGEREYGIEEFRAALEGSLPGYMMPTHCVKKDDFKFLCFGKIDRLSFKEPQ